MNKKQNDCYFYYNSTCDKGDDCEFRHCSQALGSHTVCKYWLMRRDCQRFNCPYRHMQSARDRKNTQCYYETQNGGCLKVHCPYKHRNPRTHLQAAIERKDSSVIFPVREGFGLASQSKQTRPKRDQSWPRFTSRSVTRVPRYSVGNEMPDSSDEEEDESEEAEVLDYEEQLAAQFVKDVSLQQPKRKPNEMNRNVSSIAEVVNSLDKTYKDIGTRKKKAEKINLNVRPTVQQNCTQAVPLLTAKESTSGKNNKKNKSSIRTAVSNENIFNHGFGIVNNGPIPDQRSQSKIGHPIVQPVLFPIFNPGIGIVNSGPIPDQRIQSKSGRPIVQPGLVPKAFEENMNNLMRHFGAPEIKNKKKCEVEKKSSKGKKKVHAHTG